MLLKSSRSGLINNAYNKLEKTVLVGLLEFATKDQRSDI